MQYLISFPFKVIVEDSPSITVSESKTQLIEHQGLSGAVLQTNPRRSVMELSYTLYLVKPSEEELFSFLKLFLKELSCKYRDDIILVVCDGAAWHKSNSLEIPSNIELFYLPPATPEMNPIEQIWKEIRKRGFRNEIFATLDKVIDRLCDTIDSLSTLTVKSITCRSWIESIFI